MSILTGSDAVMAPLSYDRYCAEIVNQTDLLRSRIRHADMTITVPTCPEWNVGQLLRHVGGAHRSIERTVRTRSTSAPSDDQWRDLSDYTNEDHAELDAWLAEGAARLADTLREAGPDATVFNPIPRGEQTPMFSARRMTHETVVHRADALIALGEEFHVEPDVALDAVDEWMALGSIPEILDVHPEKRALLELDETLNFHATDVDPAANADWVIDLTGTTIVWRRARDTSAACVNASLTDILLILYRRRPLNCEGTTIDGNTQLLDAWRELASFG
jgi:uncharacterized protein (TIGR03083 family)